MTRRRLGVAIAVVMLAGCAGNNHSATSPKGAHARDINNLWWFLFAIAVIVCAVVFMLVCLAGLRRRRDRGIAPGENVGGHPLVLWGGVVIPTIVLVGTFVAVMVTLNAVEAAPGHGPGVTINVVARQWFWDVTYPQNGATTANEIHIPVDVPVTINVTSPDVIHSFWVPSLDRKIDAIPGHTNTITLDADHIGTYRGQCAEFCGLQHAHMAFSVVAQTRADFDTWLQQQSAPASQPTDALAEQGQQVFLGSCDYCHTVRGTNASGHIGPDLTHLASRARIGAETIPNTPGDLAGWVLDSQHVKPGNLMPPLSISGDELQQLLAYLEQLR